MMMNGRKAYEIWIDNNAKWTQWTRPVAFAGSNYMANSGKTQLFLPHIAYAEQLSNEVAVILDLPDCEAIEEGMSLAKLGVRPVAIYNGTNAPKNSVCVVYNDNIQSALLLAAQCLKDVSLEPDAPPAFLLDSNRTQRFKMNVSVFDNSWDVYGQDMPSAHFLVANGTKRILVRSEKIQRDLKILLYNYQQKGILIFHINQNFETKQVTIKKPQRKRNT